MSDEGCRRGVIDWPRIARAIVESGTRAALMIESNSPEEDRGPLEGYLQEAMGR